MTSLEIINELTKLLNKIIVTLFIESVVSYIINKHLS